MIISPRLVFRILVVILSVVMCIIQLETATLKLIDPPTVVTIIDKDIADIDLPIVTICQTDQGNMTRLNELNYTRVVDLLNGYTGFNGSERLLTWGQHANLTFDQVLGEVFPVQAATDILIEKQEDIEKNIKFIPRHGKCQEVSKFNPMKELMIMNQDFTNPLNSKKILRVFITDRNYQSHYSIDYPSHTGDKIEIHPLTEYYIDVKLSIVSTCNTVAEESKTNNFKQCVDDEVNDHFRKNPGCTPPWLSQNNHCNKSIPYPNVENYNFVPNLHEDYILNLLTLKQSKVEKNCRKYCRTLSSEVKIRETAELNTFSIQQGWNKGGEAHISFDPTVKVTETSFNYGPFQYVIDVGSSLGLWLGLSVLGLYDLSETALNYAKHSVDSKKN